MAFNPFNKTMSANLQNNVISVIHHCQSKDATMLCIRDFINKSTQSHDDHYDLGGTYTGSESDLWFYMTTSKYSEEVRLINLFVCHRKVGDVFITLTLNGISSSHIFKSSKPNENYHLKTFCVTPKELIAARKENLLYIPITIEIDPTKLVNPEVIREMKIQNSIGEQLLKQKKDFILESISREQYPVHKLVLCAHSPVLRELVKNSSKTSQFLDISDEDMRLLIQFLYTGTIKDMHKIECMTLQKLACKFELSNLFLLAQHYICDQLNVENAVEIAVLAKTYNLEQLWEKVCSFIRQNPAVLATESWKSINDVDLTKKLCAALVK